MKQHLFALPLAWFALTSSACIGDSSPPDPIVNSESHFLTMCSSDAECGAPSACLCGFCTQLCDPLDGPCAHCVAPSYIGSACAEEVPQFDLCAEGCTTNADCGALLCDQRLGICKPGPDEGEIELQTLGLATLCRGSRLSVGTDSKLEVAADNIYILQLSDKDGDFSAPRVLQRTARPEFDVVIPEDLPVGSGYRMRVVTTNPYVEGPATAEVIGIDERVYPRNRQLSIVRTTVAALPNTPVRWVGYSGLEDVEAYTLEWRFGADATPSTSDKTYVSVSYATAGRKEASLIATSANGCQSVRMARGASPQIYDCTVSLPSETEVVHSSPAPDTIGPKWICSGTRTVAVGSQLFLEPDTDVTKSSLESVVWMKPGATYDGQNAMDDVVIKSEGSIVYNMAPERVLECPVVVFDLSNGPADACE